MKSKKRGFTLPEVVVVLIIIALAFSVSAALVPSMDKARDTARRLLCANGLRRIGAAMIMYAGTYDNLIPTDSAMINGNNTQDKGHPYVVYRGDKQWTATYNPKTQRYAPLRWACLFEAGLITEPNLFYCPNNKSSMFRYESYIDPPPWGTLPQVYNNTPGVANQWIRMGYTYYPTDPTTTVKYDMQTAQDYREPNCTRFDRLDGTMPYATDVIWTRVALSHKSGIRKSADYRATVVFDPGINALFKDGHIVYCNNQEVFGNRTGGATGNMMSVFWYLKENGRLGTSGTYAFYYTIFGLVQP